MTTRAMPTKDREIPISLLIAGWAAAGVVLLGQGVLEAALGGGLGSPTWLLRWRVAPWVLWGVAAPVFVRLGVRVPIAWPPRTSAVAVHAAVFGAWMVVSNALLRVPELLARIDAAIGREILAAATEYSVPGALAYGLIVIVGPRLLRASDEPADPRHLPLNSGERIHLVAVNDVRWVEADGDYVRVHTDAGPRRVRGTMKEFERRLSGERFLRVHRSTIVNVDYIRELQPYFNGDYVAVLRDGTTLRVPRTRRDVIARFLDG